MVFNVRQLVPGGSLWLQWVAGVGVMMMMFVIGLSIGWSSPYMAELKSGNSSFPATVHEIYWLASTPSLGRLSGAILGAVCVLYFGSKTTMFGNGCALFITWTLVIVANSVNWLYVSRFISGMSIEIASVSFPLYLGDISSSRIRGALVTFAMNGIAIGILAGNAMGHYLSMKLFAWVTLVPIICFLLVFLWIPHSPYYLMSKGKIEDTERSILWYNPNANAQLEVESIKKFLAISNSNTFIERLREFIIPRNRKVTITVIALNMFSCFSGLVPLTTYMESIIIRSMVIVIAPSTVPMIASGVGLITGWIGMYFTEKFERKIMWVVSSAGICGSLIVLGTHFYLISDEFDMTKLQWLPIFSIVSFKLFFNLGVSCIGTILFSELFASNIQPIAGCVISVVSAISGFLAINGYQFLLELIPECYVWWINVIIMATGSIYGLVLIPETKGKTLLEIQDDLTKNESYG